MKLQANFFILSFSIAFCCNSQSLCVKQTGQLQRVIHYFFYDSDVTKSCKDRKGASEAFLCFLTIDSVGRVGGIHFLADEQNRDSAYIVLSKMKPADFKDWKSEDCKGKTIMIPIILIGSEDKPKYVSDLFEFRAFARGEHKNLIMLSGLDLYWPESKQ